MATFPDTRHATNTPITAVEYVGSGNQFIYSNNPEYNSSGALLYHYGFILPANSPRDVEIYHNLSNGKNGAARGGMAIKNMGNATATITVKGTRDYFQRGIGKQNTLDCAKLLKAALSASNRTYTLAAGQSMFIDDKSFTFASGESSRLVYGRYTVTSSQSNVHVRTFTGNVNHTLSQLFDPKREMSPCSNNDQFSGLLGYNTKKLKTPFPAQMGTAFLIGEWWQSGSESLYNAAEYTPSTAKPGGNTKPAGNFGVVYELNFTGSAGKIIKIMPNITTGEGCLLRSVNGSAFEVTNYLSAADIAGKSCWTAVLGSSSTATVKLIIPGANVANIKIEVC